MTGADCPDASAGRAGNPRHLDAVLDAADAERPLRRAALLGIARDERLSTAA